MITLLCAQAAYLIADSQPDVFAARSQITYQGDTWVETQSEAVKSPDLWLPVAIDENIDPVVFEANWDAGQVLGTQIIRFQYNSEDHDQALRVVDAVTTRYLAEFAAIAATPDPLLLQYETLKEGLVNEQADLEAQIAARLDLARTGQVDPVLTDLFQQKGQNAACLLYTSPSPRDATLSRMPSSA